MNIQPQALAREEIDQQLTESGWVVQESGNSKLGMVRMASSHVVP